MFGARFFAGAYFSRSYFGDGGVAPAAADGAYCGARFFGPAFFGPRFFSVEVEAAPGPGTGPLTDEQYQQLYLWVNELALIHGLVVGSDLVVTPTARSAGAVEQTIIEAAGVVTVVRP